jgi:hypothetical protein
MLADHATTEASSLAERLPTLPPSIDAHGQALTG